MAEEAGVHAHVMSGLVEEVRLVLLTYDVVGIAGADDEYSEESLLILAGFSEVSCAEDMVRLVHETLTLSFSGLVGPRSECEAVGLELWEIRCRG